VKYDSASKDVFKNGMYWQDHKPVTRQSDAVGHAVRAVYMYAGMADVAALTGDKDYIEAIDRIWQNAVGKKLYVTGGIGAAGDGERFGNDYELPNSTAYCETCASIGNVYWNHRMFLLNGESKYIDVLEKTLYNGLLSGVGMDGKTFFYTNTLAIKDHFRHADIETKRSTWFSCSCCPTNVTRVMPSIPGYAYAQRQNEIYVNLFISGSAKLKDSKGAQLIVRQESNFPWDGNVKVFLEPKRPTQAKVLIRIPGWARNEALPTDLYRFGKKTSDNAWTIALNGKAMKADMQNGYAVLDRLWKKGDVIELVLPMEVQRVYANEKVQENIGKVALQRGPLMYCAEAVDNNGKASNILFPPDADVSTSFKPELLNGVITLSAEVPAFTIGDNQSDISTVQQKFIAIPYYAWAHRGEGEMTVWFPERIKGVELITK
jgi:uncharacterized protein